MAELQPAGLSGPRERRHAARKRSPGWAAVARRGVGGACARARRVLQGWKGRSPPPAAMSGIARALAPPGEPGAARRMPASRPPGTGGRRALAGRLPGRPDATFAPGEGLVAPSRVAPCHVSLRQAAARESGSPIGSGQQYVGACRCQRTPRAADGGKEQAGHGPGTGR